MGDPAGATARLFSYGTLQREPVQLRQFGRVLAGEPDVLPGHRQDWVTITDPDVVALSGTDRHPIVRHTGDPADTAKGTVLTVTAEELAAADVYEVDDYRRCLVELGSGPAWVYLATTD
ncbi:gamma-glutamylcyclotransferase family protein [Nocardia sp. NRRL S-836]|uniref:gamma-glutamylcyclotransferase family protein n=1 Tax=Nocardia sp. NRRL S-836 TaxID=1519492 RepID=UPI001E5577FB|nr:gamma-glutamylcyclotransferase family protein [Nocardia sp. NRRL S-836]